MGVSGRQLETRPARVAERFSAVPIGHPQFISCIDTPHSCVCIYDDDDDVASSQ